MRDWNEHIIYLTRDRMAVLIAPKFMTEEDVHLLQKAIDEIRAKLKCPE